MTIDKVVLEEEVKLFRANVILLPLWSSFYDWSEAKLEWPSPVPVTDDSCFRIGSADVYSDGRFIRAKVVIDYQCPERFNIQTGQDIYAHPMCVIDVDEAGLLDPLSPCKVTGFRLKSIKLRTDKPACRFIDPLTEDLGEVY